MSRLAAAARRLAEAVLAAAADAVLLVVFFAVALPLGLLRRFFQPHPSWRPAPGSRWEAPDPGRDPADRERARRPW